MASFYTLLTTIYPLRTYYISRSDLGPSNYTCMKYESEEHHKWAIQVTSKKFRMTNALIQAYTTTGRLVNVFFISMLPTPAEVPSHEAPEAPGEGGD